MKILQINQNYNYGSTGRIMKEINDTIVSFGYDGYMLAAYSYIEADNLYLMNSIPPDWDVKKNILMPRLTGLTGYRKRNSTKKAIEWIKKINPDIIHLHNVHGDWININLLFKFLVESQIPVVWTLHDCWAFTGRCSHFENAGCYKWLNGCYDCNNKKVYPITYFFDFSKKMWIDKRNLFTKLNLLRIVTPSDWLGKYVGQSFLFPFKVETINNGIDVDNFSPQNSKSPYLEDCDGKNIILGVASMWNNLKGLDDFIQLSKKLDSNYQIVLVGLNATQLKQIPSNIIGIGRTRNIEELAQLYYQSTVFVNATYQDNYPTVNLESIACGTPVITYKTGGSVESVSEKVGLIVEQGDIDGLLDAIKIICDNRESYACNCRKYAELNFDKYKNYQKYIDIYKEINGK